MGYKESKMIDWTNNETEIRNYGIRKKTGISIRWLLMVFLLLVPAMGSIIFQLWVRGQITDVGYKIHGLSRREEALNQELVKLIVRVERLQSPERVDRIARDRLGMMPLRPEQILPPQIQHVSPDRSEMAMNGN